MWCCVRALAGIVGFLELLIFFGVIGLHGIFCIIGFEFKKQDLSCKDYFILYWPLLLFLAAIKLWANISILLCSSKNTTITQPKKQLRRVEVYIYVTIPIMLFEIALGLFILGSSTWFSGFIMIILFGLAGKNLFFLLLVLPLRWKLHRRLYPRPAVVKPEKSKVQKEIKIKKRKQRKCMPPVFSPMMKVARECADEYPPRANKVPITHPHLTYSKLVYVHNPSKLFVEVKPK